jgi:hypothetical protein
VGGYPHHQQASADRKESKHELVVKCAHQTKNSLNIKGKGVDVYIYIYIDIILCIIY